MIPNVRMYHLFSFQHGLAYFGTHKQMDGWMFSLIWKWVDLPPLRDLRDRRLTGTIPHGRIVIHIRTLHHDISFGNTTTNPVDSRILKVHKAPTGRHREEKVTQSVWEVSSKHQARVMAGKLGQPAEILGD